MPTSVLQVHRLRSEYIVARDHPSPQRVRDELDTVAADLPARLASGLAHWGAARPDEVVLIERLVLECEVDLGREASLIADRWAYRIARSLIDAVDSSDGAMRFPSPAAYRARYITDRAAGDRGDTWYYRPFAGLSVLPPAVAIRSLLTEDAALGRATLEALPSTAWRVLAPVLTPREVDRILAVLGGAPAGAATVDDVDSLLEALGASGRALDDGCPPCARALYVFTAALSRRRPATDRAAAWALIVGALPAVVATLPPDVVRLALTSADVVTLAAAAPGIVSTAWAALREVTAPVREALAQGVDALPGTVGAVRVDAAISEVAPHAGLALLLPEIDALLDPAVCASLPPTSTCAPRALAAWLSMAASAGRAGAAAMLGSRFWRELFGLPPRFGLANVEAWLAGTHAQPALDGLAARAAALARGEPRLAVVRWDGQALWLHLDDRTGLWLGAAERSGAQRASLSCSRRAARDRDFLDALGGLAPDWRRFFLQTAQVALRRLAYRLPGCANSSLPYLHANVLGGSGLAVEIGPQWRVQLPRPPLHTLLNLTGLSRGAIHWSGPPAREVRLEYRE